MQELILNNQTLPSVIETGFFQTNVPFYHMRRTADFNVLIYVTKGVIYVTEDSREYEIRPGNLLILKKGIFHYGQHEIPKGTQWYYIHFRDFAAISEDCKTLQIPEFSTGLSGSKIESEIAGIVDAFHSENPEILWTVNNLLFSVLTELYNLNLEPAKKENESQKICNYLDKNSSKPFNAAEISNTFCLSYKRLAAIFKKETGISMQQYDAKNKIQKAQKLLRTTDFSINQIAELCGYEDSLYFSRYFHKQTGMSPSIFRNQPVRY